MVEDIVPHFMVLPEVLVEVVQIQLQDLQVIHPLLVHLKEVTQEMVVQVLEIMPVVAQEVLWVQEEMVIQPVMVVVVVLVVVGQTHLELKDIKVETTTIWVVAAAVELDLKAVVVAQEE
jgi:hypothetical protein